jgi:hypothetical protein
MGRATVLAFLREGARAFATDIDAGKLDMLRDQAGVTTRKLDVLNPAEIRAFSKEIDVPDDPLLPARHDRPRQRHDRQHGIGRLDRHRGVEPLHLRHDQGGGDRSEEIRSARLCRPG